MSPHVLIHPALTVLATLLGGGAWFALTEGHLRVGLQLVVLVLVAFGAMVANKQHHERTGAEA
jgi:hypothetical protein